MSAEQTPDIALSIAATLRAHRSVVSGDVDGWHVVCASCGDLGLGPDVDAHVAAALAPVLAAAVREARAAELREAADELSIAVQYEGGYIDSVVLPDELRARADRITEPVSHEAATSGEEASKA